MGDLHVIKVQIWMHLEFGYTRKWKSSTREQIENLHKQKSSMHLTHTEILLQGLRNLQIFSYENLACLAHEILDAFKLIKPARRTNEQIDCYL